MVQQQTILVTGAGGWLGSLLPKRIVEREPETSFKFILADIVEPKAPAGVEAVTLKADLTDDANLEALFTTRFGRPDVIYSMHGIMSLGSEENWDLGMKVNLDSTRLLLDKARHAKGSGAPIGFVFTSSVATYGGALPDVVTPSTACTPEGAYGTAKLLCEYLVTEYTRKGFVRGLSIKLPTIVVRPGPPSRATSAFVSGIVREPLHGERAVCPIGRSIDDPALERTGVWVASPSTTLDNFVIAKRVALEQSVRLHRWSRTVQLPGFTVTVKGIVDALRTVEGEEAVKRIAFEHDETSARLVSSWPKAFDNSYALSLGFHVDQDGFEGCVREFKRDYVPKQ